MVYKYTTRQKTGGAKAPFLYNMRIIDAEILYIIKYAFCVIILISIILAPAWVARQNGHGKPRMQGVRIASWAFGWSIIAWLWSLYQATKK